MKSAHKAQALRDAALELVLEHPRGQQILEASGGDPEHALRIIDAINRRDHRPLAEVIHLPREPILDITDVFGTVELADDEPARGVDWLLAIGLGLVAWATLAAVALAAYWSFGRFT